MFFTQGPNSYNCTNCAAPQSTAASFTRGTAGGAKDLEDEDENGEGEGEGEEGGSANKKAAGTPSFIKRPAISRLSISRPPLILTLHLKRFSQTARGGMEKSNKHVDFPLMLDLAPYCLDTSQKAVYR